MKTLKKTLCLVLAVVMAVGVMVLPANAAKEDYDAFKDKSKIQYEEAVATLTGMGIISGKSATSFDPTSALTRAEAMTLIVRALVTPDGVKTLPEGVQKFNDVKKDHYAYKYVNWAVAQGIAAGKSATSFDPDATVTAYELARWLLVATGVKTAKDFTPADWQGQTGPAAEAAGFLTGLTEITDMNKALSREMATQMIWNAVNYTSGETTLDYTVTDEAGNVLYHGTDAAQVKALAELLGTTQTLYLTTKRVAEGSIGDRLYGLTKATEIPLGEDPWSRPDVKWTNGKAENEWGYEVYSVVTTTGINEFYVGGKKDTVTVQDIVDSIGIKASTKYTYTLSVDGKVVGNGTLNNVGTKVLVNARGARVMIYPDLEKANNYVVYVVFPYASYLTKTEVGTDDVTLHFNYDAAPVNTYHGTTTTAKGALGEGSVVLYNLTYKNSVSGEAVDPTSRNADDNVTVVARNNNSNDPYFRISGADVKNKLVYASEKAIIATLSGSTGGYDVKKLTYSDVEVSTTKHYNVWYDWAGNVLALVETANPPAAKDKVDDYAYVLEYSTKAGIQGVVNDDMSYGMEDIPSVPAEAKVLMVDLKTGTVTVTPLNVIQEGPLGDQHWYITDLRGQKYLEITETVMGVIGNTTKTFGYKEDPNAVEKVVHGFVGFKVQPNGKMSVVNIDDLRAMNYDVTYDVAYTIDTSTKTFKDGRVDIELLNREAATRYADLNSKFYLLTAPTLTTDKTRVASYTAETLTGYTELGAIHTRLDEGEPGKLVAHYGIHALFIRDSKTNMITEAFIFGSKEVTPAPTVYPWYVFTGREESVAGEGTVFHFLHNGEAVDIPCDYVAYTQMMIELDNKLDVGTVVVPTIVDGKLTALTKYDDATLTNLWTKLDNVTGFVAGNYIADETWTGFAGKNPAVAGIKPGDTFKLTSNCMIYDLTTKTMVNSVSVGDQVIGFINDSNYNSFSLLVITGHAA